MNLLDGVVADATFSPCGTYRYTLTRGWGTADGRWRVLWIMLNPSTASHLEDDRTIRKCQKFARAWGCNGITVANLFALRARNPKELYRHRDPVGPDNDEAIRKVATAPGTRLVVVAWGQHGAFRNRGLIVLERLVEWGVQPMRLGAVTKGGHPWHPLYRPDDTVLEPAVSRPERDAGHGH